MHLGSGQGTGGPKRVLLHQVVQAGVLEPHSDVAGTLARASARGGTLLYPVTEVGEQGVVAEFADTEGNRIALSGPG